MARLIVTSASELRLTPGAFPKEINFRLKGYGPDGQAIYQAMVYLKPSDRIRQPIDLAIENY